MATTSKSLKNISSLLTGRFLTLEQLEKNWGLIAFVSAMALVMISSSHLADSKSHVLSKKREELKELSSEYVEMHSQLMNKSMESEVLLRAKNELNLIQGDKPPLLLKANTTETN
jgi:hypothetical protein